MLFNSPGFILLFLPITLLVCYGLAARSQRSAILWLVAASAFFYGWFNVKLLLLLGLSIVFNFYFGRKLAADRKSGRSLPIWLAIGVFANLSVLAYFKYTNFLIDNANLLFGTNYVLQNILLPIGISFFTFQKIAYLVDAYRGEAEEYDFLGFCLFVLYFPQLIAGPIVHHKEIIPQFRYPGIFRYSHDNFASGCCLFVFGLAKKVLVADGLAGVADPVFSAAADGTVLTAGLAWVGALAFTFQIYFDFSGYTDMALGLALMTGIRLPLNFNSPYKSVNIIEFWRRWHMTLSRFMRDYIYFPLGGNRLGSPRRFVNLMITMLIGGLWHGAAWTFVFWGGLHGLYLAINHGWQTWSSRRSGLRGPSNLRKWLGRTLTFLAVVVAWVFFRANGFHTAIVMLKSMIGAASNPSAAIALPVDTATLYALLAGLLWWVWFMPNSHEVLRRMKPALGVEGDVNSISESRGILNRIGITSPDGTIAANAWTGSVVGAVLLGLLLYQALRSATLQQFIYFQF